MGWPIPVKESKCLLICWALKRGYQITWIQRSVLAVSHRLTKRIWSPLWTMCLRHIGTVQVRETISRVRGLIRKQPTVYTAYTSRSRLSLSHLCHLVRCRMRFFLNATAQVSSGCDMTKESSLPSRITRRSSLLTNILENSAHGIRSKTAL